VGLEGVTVTALDAYVAGSDTMLAIGTADSGVYVRGRDSTLFPLRNFIGPALDSLVSTVHCIYIKDAGTVLAGSDSGLYAYYLSMGAPRWIKQTDIASGPVTAIEGRGDTLFASVPHDIYRSVDGGTRWVALDVATYLPLGQSLPHFTSLALSGFELGTVLAGSRFGGSFSSWWGVLLSPDWGETWRSINDSLDTKIAAVFSVCVYKPMWNGPITYACGTDRGIFERAEGNKAWSPRSDTLLGGREVYDVYVTMTTKSSLAEMFACTDSGVCTMMRGKPGELSLALRSYAMSSLGTYEPREWFAGTVDGLYRYTRDPVNVSTWPGVRAAGRAACAGEVSCFSLLGRAVGAEGGSRAARVRAVQDDREQRLQVLFMRSVR
jgi:hypothetical protein